MVQYVLYLRKSRADLEAESRGEGETLARHRDTLLELAKRQGLSVREIYAEVVSGETIGARPMMQKLLSEVEQGVWTGVLVMEVERLARGDTIDQGIVAQAFKFSNTKIITPMKTYDPRNEFDEEYFEFGLFMSRREYKTITRRMQRGRLASVQEGKFVGNHAPYGYSRKKLVGEKGFTLEPIPEQAEAVRWIFEWYVNGEQQGDGTRERLGYGKIAQKLEALQFPTDSGKPWSVATVKEILANPVYIGQVRWNQRPEVKHVADGKIVRERPRSKTGEVILAEGRHPSIVDTEMFLAAQGYFSQRLETAVPKGKSLKNPLAKIVRCGICGKTMVRKPYGNGYPDTLICTSRNCPNVSIQLQYVEKRLLQLLDIWLGGYQVKLDAPISTSMSEGEMKEQAVARLKKELDTLLRQSDTLHDLLEQGVYSLEVFQERWGKVEGKIKTVRGNLQMLEQELRSCEEREGIRPDAIPKSRSIVELYYATEDPNEKNRLLREILDKAVYQKTGNGKYRDNDPDAFELVVYPLLPACNDG